MLTLVPVSWLIRPISAIYDLDNIRLSAIKENEDVEADFELENILVQGSCNKMISGHAADNDTGEPPRGLQFLLKTDVGGIISDTITMANLGYLQLKANPGVYDMVIRPGRGRELYEFKSITDSRSYSGSLIGDYGAKVVVDSFTGATVYPVVSKRPGKKAEKLIENTDSESKDEGFWESVKSK